MSKTIATAAMLIIGNEILSGRTQDTNLLYAAKFLNDLGVEMREARVVPDIAEHIIDAINTLRNKYTYVLTSGGIGPTHDDITAQCVADAFSVPLEEDSSALAALLTYYGSEQELTATRRRMARFPRGAIPIENPVTGAPGFRILNVFVLAGIPRVQRAMLESVAHQFEGGEPLVTQTIRAQTGESRIAELMEQIQQQYPIINIGSYPSLQDGKAIVRIVCRGRDVIALYDCVLLMQNALNAQNISNAIEISPTDSDTDDDLSFDDM